MEHGINFDKLEEQDFTKYLSYMTRHYALEQKKELKQSEQKEYQQDIAKKLKDDDYATKYARAKYSFSKDGEYVYTIPDLLPQ